MEESTEKVLNDMYSENLQMRQLLFSLKEAVGINPMDSPDEVNRKIRVINYFRLGFIPSHGIDLEWNIRESQTAIPYLIEHMKIHELEQLVELGSLAIANLSAILKGHPTIKIRRAQKAAEDKAIAEEQKKKTAETTPHAKTVKRAELRGTKAENKAVAQLMTTGMSEDAARKRLGFK